MPLMILLLILDCIMVINPTILKGEMQELDNFLIQVELNSTMDNQTSKDTRMASRLCILSRDIEMKCLEDLERCFGKILSLKEPV